MDVTHTIPNLFLDFMQMQEFAKDPLVFAGGEGIRQVASVIKTNPSFVMRISLLNQQR
jgi:hypothetical protein